MGEFPGKIELSTLSRDNLSREIWRMRQGEEEGRKEGMRHPWRVAAPS